MRGQSNAMVKGKQYVKRLLKQAAGTAGGGTTRTIKAGDARFPKMEIYYRNTSSEPHTPDCALQKVEMSGLRQRQSGKGQRKTKKHRAASANTAEHVNQNNVPWYGL